MPFLAIVHLHELTCSRCKALLARPGSRSFIVDGEGDPVPFDAEDPPAEMRVEILCPSGHAAVLFVPNEVSAEPALETPEDAPIAADATLREGTSESGRALMKV